MNPVLIAIIFVILFILWFLLSFIFYPLGKFIYRVFKDAMDNINKTDDKIRKERDKYER